MKIYTVTFDNEVLAVFTSYILMREYVWREFEDEFRDLSQDMECDIDEQDCLDYCSELEVTLQSFTVEA